MTAIDTLLQQPAAQAIGWALLQFVWQGALVGVLSALALFAAPPQRRGRPLRRGDDRPVADAHDAGSHGPPGVAFDDRRRRASAGRSPAVGAGKRPSALTVGRLPSLGAID